MYGFAKTVAGLRHASEEMNSRPIFHGQSSNAPISNLIRETDHLQHKKYSGPVDRKIPHDFVDRFIR